MSDVVGWLLMGGYGTLTVLAVRAVLVRRPEAPVGTAHHEGPVRTR